MAVFIGVDSVAKPVKNMYVGIDGTAHQIKKAYIGVDGAAKLFYALEESVPCPYEYYGAVSPLDTARTRLSCVSDGSDTFFAGGWNGDDFCADIEIYSLDLVKTSSRFGLNRARADMGAAHGGERSSAFFAGGEDARFGAGGMVDVVNNMGTAYTTDGLAESRYCMAASVNYSGRIFFAGGQTSATSYSSAVDVYNSSSWETIHTTNLGAARCQLASACTMNDDIGPYAFIAGGYNGAPVNTAEAYDYSYVRTTLTGLTQARYKHAAAAVDEKYACFVGGLDAAGNAVTSAEAYSDTLVHQDLLSYPVGLKDCSATSTPDGNIVFGGGATNQAYMYNLDLVLIQMPDLGYTMRAQGAGAAGVDYVLFGGGEQADATGANWTMTNSVVAYKKI